MRRQLILSAVAFLALSSPARACLNDRETAIREFEFKSQYQPASSPSSEEPARPWHFIMNQRMTLTGLGALFALSGLALGLTAPRPGSK